MSLCDDSFHQRALPMVRVDSQQSGGSIGNTMWNFGRLGGHARFIGAVADDANGALYRSDMAEAGISCHLQVHPVAAASDDPRSTASCLVMVTPDGERTMATNLGIAGNIPAALLSRDENFAALDDGVLAVESYLFDAPDAAVAISEWLRSQVLLVLSLSDPFCVERHGTTILAYVQTRASIVVGNYDEAKALAVVACGRALADAELVEWLASTSAQAKNLIIVTRSAEPVWIFDAGTHTSVATERTLDTGQQMKPVIDTTGAGDAFLAGVLYQLMRGPDNTAPLVEAVDLGNRLARATIAHLGPRLAVEGFAEIDRR